MPKDVSLPYNTKPENVEKLVEVLGNRDGYTIEESDARSIYGGSMFNPTKRAAIELQIIEKTEDGLKLTEVGKKFLIEGREALRECVLDYEPYHLSLEKHSHSKSNIIKKDDVKELLAQKFEVSDRVQEGAALFFLKIIQYIGWGEYKIGRKRPTRVELTVDLSEILSAKEEDTGEELVGEDSESDGFEQGSDHHSKIVVRVEGDKIDQKVEIEKEYDWELAKSIIESVEENWRKEVGDN